MTPSQPRTARVSIDGTIFHVEMAASGLAKVAGWPEPLQVVQVDSSTFQVTVEGRQRLVYVAVEGAQGWVFTDGCVSALDMEPNLEPGGLSSTRRADANRPIAAPMPATVLSVLVERGQSVREGDPLVLLEAMKMELTLKAPRDGQIGTIACAGGDLVKPGAPLVTLLDDAALSNG